MDSLEIEDNLLLPHDIDKKNHSTIKSKLLKFKHFILNNKLLVFAIAVLLVTAIVVIPISIEKSKEKKKDSLSEDCDTLGVQVMNEALKGTNGAYSRLSNLTMFGGRLSGSQNLENAIDWLQAQMVADGFQNVKTQQVQVTNWKRNRENATLVSPFARTLNMAGLAGSISTGGAPITADVVVVADFAELDQLGAGVVKGKIVLFNAPFTSYGVTVQYRTQGAIHAAQYGAVAALVRSVTPFSIGSPHTGAMSYQSNVTQIPGACITLEDSDLIQNLYSAGQNVSVSLYMEAETLPPATSRNLMGEITGSEYPNEVVVIGGHIDCFDLGVGALDDGGGVMAAYETVMILKSLGITPKRTIRVVAWTNEENGAAGALAYAQAYANQTFFSIESDGGVTTPTGLSVGGLSEESISNLQLIANQVVVPFIGPYSIAEGGVGTDNGPLVAAGYPGAEFATDMSTYFWYHHTAGDAIDKINSTQLDQCIGTMAALSICIANYNSALN